MLSKLFFAGLSALLIASDAATAATFKYEGHLNMPGIIGGDSASIEFSGTIEVELPVPATSTDTDDGAGIQPVSAFGTASGSGWSVGSVSPTIFDVSNVIPRLFFGNEGGEFNTQFFIYGDENGISEFVNTNDFSLFFADVADPRFTRAELQNGIILPLFVSYLANVGEPDFRTEFYGDGKVTITEMAPIPLPAAGWLFLTALSGFAWFRRR